jgi:hypothetical protein
MSYLGENRLLKPMLSVFNLRSERNINVVCRARIATIFFVCLGKLVDRFNELQFCELTVRCVRLRMPVVTCEVTCTCSGDAHNLVLGRHSSSDRDRNLSVDVQDVEGEGKYNLIFFRFTEKIKRGQ